MQFRHPLLKTYNRVSLSTPLRAWHKGSPKLNRVGRGRTQGQIRKRKAAKKIDLIVIFMSESEHIDCMITMFLWLPIKLRIQFGLLTPNSEALHNHAPTDHSDSISHTLCHRLRSHWLFCCSSNTGNTASAPPIFGAVQFFVVVAFLCCRMFNSICGLYLLHFCNSTYPHSIYNNQKYL